MIMNPLNGVSFSAGANHNRRIMRKVKKMLKKHKTSKKLNTFTCFFLKKNSIVINAFDY